MIKNDIALCLFIIYSIYLPMVIAEAEFLSDEHYRNLVLFDIIFILDRFSDLFVVFINKQGIPEPSLYKVIMNNISFEIFLEILLTVAPVFLINV